MNSQKSQPFCRRQREARFVLGRGQEDPLMTHNLYPLDAGIRAGIGLFLLASPLLRLETYPYNLLGLVLIATALVRYCPFYSLGSALRRFSESPLAQRSPKKA
jgi:hypothetical protein